MMEKIKIIIEEGTKADFAVGNIYFLLPIFRKTPPSFLIIHKYW